MRRLFQWCCFPATRRSIALTRRCSWYLAQLRQLKCILLCSARSIELYCNVIFNVLFFFLRLCWCRLEKLFTMLRERAKAGPKRKITNVDVQEPDSKAQGRIPLQSEQRWLRLRSRREWQLEWARVIRLPCVYLNILSTREAKAIYHCIHNSFISLHPNKSERLTKSFLFW